MDRRDANRWAPAIEAILGPRHAATRPKTRHGGGTAAIRPSRRPAGPRHVAPAHRACRAGVGAQLRLKPADRLAFETWRVSAAA